MLSPDWLSVAVSATWPETSTKSTSGIPEVSISILENDKETEPIPLGTLSGILAELHSTAKQNLQRCLIVFRSASKCKVDDSLKALRHLGLFAMEYGGVFVGSVRLSSPTTPDADSIGALEKVMKEAKEFNGPSLLLLNSDCRFRWLPSQSPSFVWGEVEDVKKPAVFARFIDTQEQLHLLFSKAPELPDEFVSLLPESSEMWKAHQQRLLALSAIPDNTIPIRRLLILYGSDSGHSETLARRLAKECPSRGVQQSLCFPLDSVTQIASTFAELQQRAATDDAPEIDAAVVVVVATAGQGEFPGNARKFWKRLAEVTELPKIRYAIFGLGDRLYWPKDPEYFCKPAVEMDSRMSELGCDRLVGVGLGNDHDKEKYETAWRVWHPTFWSALKWDRTGAVQETEEAEEELPSDETLKIKAKYLRGTLKETLEDVTTGQVPYSDTKTIKFHGIYQQDHRDFRTERAGLGLEPFYSFMARLRLPGGVCTSEQWLGMDSLSSKFGDQTMKLTTRQTFQLHGLLKWNLKASLQEMNRVCMDTIATSGDVNRNVLVTSTPGLCSEQTYQQIQHYGTQFSEFVLPHTLAYHEVFLEGPNGELPSSTPNDRLKTPKIKVGGSYVTGQGMCPKKVDAMLVDDLEEPLYGPTYLPRKFKIAVAIPPVNDVDVFAHCVGFIADISKTENGDVLNGFTVTVGGGMGRTHNEPSTYPRLADVMGFCLPEEAKLIVAAVMAVQRDAGDRQNRRHARFKYTVEDLGVNEVRRRVEEFSGVKMGAPRHFEFTSRGDRYGWMKDLQGGLHYGLFIEGGRVSDTDTIKMRTCLREIAQNHSGVFRLTCNQHLIISNVPEEQKGKIQTLLQSHGCAKEDYSITRLNSMACVALPTCPLAFAESERYLPSLMTKIEGIMSSLGLQNQQIVTRMTGCPNGCARPFVAELGFVGRSLGFYDLHLGGDALGQRLSRRYKEGLNEESILELLQHLLKDFAEKKTLDEGFGDFCFRHLSLEQYSC